MTASEHSRVRKWLYESTVWSGKSVARNRRTWQHVDNMSERRKLLRHTRVIYSQFWDSNSNELISDLWFVAAVNSGTQTGICYGIAFHCSVMVVWVESSIDYQSIPSDASWHFCSSLVPISLSTPSLLVCRQLMSNHSWKHSLLLLLISLERVDS